MAGYRLAAIVAARREMLGSMGTQHCTRTGEGCNGERISVLVSRNAVDIENGLENRDSIPPFFGHSVPGSH